MSIIYLFLLRELVENEKFSILKVTLIMKMFNFSRVYAREKDT